MLKTVIIAVLLGVCVAMPSSNETDIKPEVDLGNSTDFFDANGTNITTTPEPTTTEDLFCVGFKPGSEPQTYTLEAAGIKYNFSCLTPLVWSQEQCSCQAPAVEILDFNCPHHRPYPDDRRKYEVRAHGVWLPSPISCPPGQIWMQVNCWCDFDPNAPILPPSSNEIDGADRRTPTPTTTTTTAQQPLESGQKGFVITKGILVGSETTAEPDTNKTDNYCEGFRPTEDARRYQLFAVGTYYNFTCQEPLVWSQKDCSCQARLVEIEDPDCPHHRAHPTDKQKYEVRAHGVWLPRALACPSNQIWNQSNCWCDFDPDFIEEVARDRIKGVPGIPSSTPCFPIFNATFDHALVDDGPLRLAIGRQPWSSVSMDHNVPGARNGAVRVINGRMPLWFTGSNPLGGKIQIRFRFKLNEETTDEKKSIVLLGNYRCSGGPRTISIQFRPTDGKYSVFFRDYNVSRTMECNSPNDRLYSFHELEMVFFNELLTLTVDGIECFGALFETELLPTACFIGLGSRHFDGWFDEVIFRKECLEEREQQN